MSKIRLKKSERPNIFFFKSIEETNNRGVHRTRLITGQYVPIEEEEGMFILADDRLNVEADHEMRRVNPVGTVFYTQKLRLVEPPNRRGYYTTGGKVGCITDDPAIQQIYLKLQNPGFTPKYAPFNITKERPAEEVEVDIASGSKIDDLLKRYPCPTPDKNDFYVPLQTWMRIIQAIERKKHLLIGGPSGTGKTILKDLLSKLYSKEITRIDFGTIQDPVAALLGVHRHEPGRGSYFDRAPFLQAITKPGLIVLDEINRATKSANNIMFGLLDDSKSITLNQATSAEDRIVHLHEDAQIVATANIGPEFTGTNQLDPAFKGRFVVVQFDYPPSEEEERILQLRTKASKKSIEIIVEVANSLREQYRSGELTEGVGMRQTLDAAQLCEDGFSLSDALEIAFIPIFPPDEQEIVKDELSSR